MKIFLASRWAPVRRERRIADGQVVLREGTRDKARLHHEHFGTGSPLTCTRCRVAGRNATSLEAVETIGGYLHIYRCRTCGRLIANDRTPMWHTGDKGTRQGLMRNPNEWFQRGRREVRVVADGGTRRVLVG